ncbi:MAG: hypothetical protein ACXV8Q_01825 [Methylobacter sp.]
MSKNELYFEQSNIFNDLRGWRALFIMKLFLSRIFEEGYFLNNAQLNVSLIKVKTVKTAKNTSNCIYDSQEYKNLAEKWKI